MRSRKSVLQLLAIFALLLCPVLAFSLQPKETPSSLEDKEFFKPDLYISNANVPIQDVLSKLPTAPVWNDFYSRYGSNFHVFIDPRSGAPSGIIGSIPFLPGSGAGNKIQQSDLSQFLGSNVDKVDEKVVSDAMRKFISINAQTLGLKETELAVVKAGRDVEHLWQISADRKVNGIPVRYSRFMATISHGNIVLLGTSQWGDVNINTTPTLSADDAVRRGFGYTGGNQTIDFIWKQPALEIVPFAPQEFQKGNVYSGPAGAGYGHRLVWGYGFQRRPEAARWEVMVDAHSGEVLAMKDINHYAKKKISGAVYPLTNTEQCATNDKCGVMQTGYPMPFSDTGLAAPNNFTNSAGVFDYTSGLVTTTLSGKFVHINDNCGPISESSSTGNLNLGGTNGQHDCTSSGISPGDTPASRSGFYELNKLIELAKGYLPLNIWLTLQMTSNMNIDNACNAFYSPVDGTINFYRTGSLGANNCANTGEIAAVFDHEWGHALDDNDTSGVLSNSSEGYADIVAILRLQASCVGHGFFLPPAGACGLASDGTKNVDEDQTAGIHCALDCSGVRDSDYTKHADGIPDTPMNFVCGKCVAQANGPCGRQVHCAAAPVRQAAWDLAARDLQNPPFNFDANTAFIAANKIFYQGSGNIVNWYACDCNLAQSNGCNADSGYLQWLAADDDDGLLINGTPHMTAINAAFSRHGIACSAIAPVNSGCTGGPTAATTLTATTGDNQVNLSWTPVAGATKYWVFRSEGFAGCNFGKALIATVTGLSYVDNQVANGRGYNYVVVAAGISDSCYGPASSCVSVTPQSCAATIEIDKSEYTCNDTIRITVTDNRAGAGSVQVAVTSARETETVNLTETPANSGIFTGTVATTGSAPVNGNGKISVKNADNILVRYTDPSYCGIPNVPIDATATSNCNVCEGSTAPGANLKVLNTAQIFMDTGDGDEFIDNCEQGRLTFQAQNIGKGKLNNVRVTKVVASHPGVQIQTPLPLTISNRLNQCAIAQGSIQFSSINLQSGEYIDFRIDVTSNELSALGITRSLNVRFGPVEQDFQSLSLKKFTFETDLEDWQGTSGTFQRETPGADGTSSAVASSKLLSDQCDSIQSPVIKLKPTSTLSMYTNYDIEPCSDACFDRANVGIVDLATGTRTTVNPDMGNPYNVSGPNGVCATANQSGWNDVQLQFVLSGWSPTALNASAYIGKQIKFDVTYGTDPLVSGTGFRFDEVVVTDLDLMIDDGHSNSCGN